MSLDTKNDGILYDERRNPIRLNPDHDVAFGNIPGRYANAASGFNMSVGTAEETIWACGGRWAIHDDYEFVSFVSDSANDAVAGTGGFVLFITGIGEDWTEYTDAETLVIDGLTPVTTARKYRLIIRVTVVGAGSSRTNEGLITGTGIDTSNLMVCIPADYGLQRQTITPIPAGRERLVEEVSFSATLTAIGANPEVVIRIRWHQMTANFSIIAYEETFDAGTGNIVIETPLANVPFPGTSVLEMTAISDKVNTEVFARMKWHDRDV